jgi:hypothetical protein
VEDAVNPGDHDEEACDLKQWGNARLVDHMNRL